MRRRIQCVALLALAATVGGNSVGCCGKEGYVIHSDWTLAMHRQPCGGGCAAGACNCQDQAVASSTRRSGRSSATAEPGPLVQGPGHFHPVPTRPVFGPRPDLLAVPVSAPAELSPGEMPDSEALPVPDLPGNSAQRSARRTAQAIASSFTMPDSTKPCEDCE